ncbi:hypothetical protein MIR68_001896 [Amoeboaphelidium protococcarum]|nr:hypothetical protein MIR68_001896 [Amoeboaphelidium protococcarum]
MSATSPTGSSKNAKINLEEQVTQFKWMDVIRKDEIDTARSLLDSSQHSSVNQALVMCAQFGTVKMMTTILQYVFDHVQLVDINYQDSNGDTCLHHASKGGRTAIMEQVYRMSMEYELSNNTVILDDTLLNNDAKDILLLAKNHQIAQLIENQRSHFMMNVYQQLYNFIVNKEQVRKFETILSYPRVKKLIDLNVDLDHVGVMNVGDGSSVLGALLHVACEHNSGDYVNLLLKYHCDPLVRDRKGRLASDRTKDERILKLLKGVLAQQSYTSLAISSSPVLQQSQSSSSAQNGKTPQKLTGTLYKWTNYAGGYKKRYFVLADGTLSYYRSQMEYPVKCRGMTSLIIAKVWVDPSDKTRFDLIMGNSPQMNDSGLAELSLTQSSSKSLHNSGKMMDDSQSNHTKAKSESGKQSKHERKLSDKGITRWHLRAEHPMETKRWIIAITEAKQWLQDHGDIPRAALNQKSGAAGSGAMVVQRKLSELSDSGDGFPQNSGFRGSFNNSNTQMLKSYNDVDRGSISDQDVLGDDSYASLKDKDKEGDKVYEDLMQQLLKNAAFIVQQHNELLSKIPNLDKQVLDMIQSSGESLQTIVTQVSKKIDDREKSWRKRLQREEQIKHIWEENLRVLAMEHDSLQNNASKQIASMSPKAKTVGNAQKVDLEQEEEEELDEFYDAIGDSLSTADYQSDGDASGGKTVSLMDSIAQGYPSAQQFRKTLPSLGKRPPEISLWSILKNNIGKDLTKIALPVFFNEPLSMLQRLCEDMEYSNLLDIAASRVNPDPNGLDTGRFERVLFVAAFAMSNYSSTQGRAGKPFNPLLGETFEYVRRDKNFRYLSEQVSHHPPISACHCESDSYAFWAQAHLKTRFRGTSLEIIPLGTCHVLLKSTGEHYSWKKVATQVNNLVIGKLYVQHFGDLVVTNHSTGDTCTVTFKQSGWTSRNQYELEGDVKSADGKVIYKLSGGWDDKLVCKPVLSDTQIEQLVKGSKNPYVGSDVQTQSLSRRSSLLRTSMSSASKSAHGDSSVGGGFVIWKRHPVSELAEKQFNLTDFAITLNELPDELRHKLPPTDSRLRPDQSAMENAEYELADQEKVRLEGSQRKRRHEREGEGAEWEPLWFQREIDEDSGEEHWVYRDNYWQCRRSGKWPEQVLPIFD